VKNKLSHAKKISASKIELQRKTQPSRRCGTEPELRYTRFMPNPIGTVFADFDPIFGTRALLSAK
jgi:hypothetical protein